MTETTYSIYDADEIEPGNQLPIPWVESADGESDALAALLRRWGGLSAGEHRFYVTSSTDSLECAVLFTVSGLGK